MLRRLPRIDAGNVCLALVFGLTLTYYAAFSLDQPYFLDTFGYLSWIETYLETGSSAGNYRVVNSYLYYLPVAWLGAYGIKVVTVAFVSLFAAV